MNKLTDMPASERDDLQTIIKAQASEIAGLKKEIEDLKEKLKGLSGYVVKAPNPGYSDVTAGVMFRAGMAFIPDGEGAEEKARGMQYHFGYTVEHVDDWHTLPEAPRMTKSFIEAISGR